MTSRRGSKIKVRGQLDRRLDTKEDALPQFRALLGDGEGNLYPNTDELTIVYARRADRGRIDWVRNTRVVPRDGLPVIVGYTRERPHELQVIEEDTAAMESLGAYGYVMRHGQQHSLHDTTGGDDPVWVWGQQFLPFLVQETDPISLQVEVRQGRYIYEGSYETFGGGRTIDLNAYAPGAGLARMLHIVVNAETATLDFIQGNTFSVAVPEHMREEMIPLASDGQIACAAIYIPNGITEVTWDEIYDTRPFVQVIEGGVPHNILSSTHVDTSPDALVRGDILVVVGAAAASLSRMAAGGAHQLCKMGAAGLDPEWDTFDWDDFAGAGGDMVHSHLSNPEGGLIGYALRTGWNLDADTEVTMSWVDGTRTLTLTPTGASYSFWVLGTMFTEAVSDDVTINDTEGLWYIYYNAAGALTASQVPWTIRDNDKAFVAVLYWDALNNEAIGGSSRWEMHAWEMDAGTHSWAHRTIGTRWQSGLAVSENPADQLEVAAGVMRDEDLYISVSDGAGAGLWEQDLSPLQAYKIYKLGAAGDWRHGGVFGPVPVILDGANDVVWNEFAAGVWGLTAAGANQYCAYWAIATPDIHNPVVIMVGQGSPSSNINTARDNNPIETLDTTSEGPEFRVLARIMVRNIAGGVFYEVSAIDDFRLIEVVAGTVTFIDHNMLPGLQGGFGNEFYHLNAADYAALTDVNAQLADLHTDQSPTFADVYVPDGGTFGITGNELLTVNAAGTFAFSGIAGITVEDGDFIGNSAATARLGFDSSGATDYAYFMGCNLGVGTITPGANIASIVAFPGVLQHIQGAAAGDQRAALILQSATESEVIWSDTGAGADDKLWMVRAMDDYWAVLPHKDDGSAAINALVVTSYNEGGNVGIGMAAPAARLDADNQGTIAQPVLRLDQGDTDFEVIEFVSAIEYAGMTTDPDEYIKVKNPSGNIRYLKLWQEPP